MKTDVIFRTDKSNGDTIAYFPYEISVGYDATCYARVGQHSQCSHEYITGCTIPCNDYEPLKRELENLFGYELNIIKRRSYKKWAKAIDEAY